MSARHAASSASTTHPLRRGRVVVVGLFLLLAALGGVLASLAGAGQATTAMTLDWSMPDRFGLDGTVEADGKPDGMVDYDLDPKFLNPDAWKVNLTVCGSPAVKAAGDAAQVIWKIAAGPEGTTTQTFTAGCATTATVKKLGNYPVRATLAGDAAATVSKTVRVQDTLIVSVGDSVASGEGNPDLMVAAAKFPGWSAKWQSAQCDRSALAGPAQAALRLEKRDPRSSVTFIHLACSGATVEKGLLGDYEGQHPDMGTPLKPQLDEAARLAGNRQIDTMTVSIGANDMGFSDIVKKCLVLVNCHTVQLGVDNAAKTFEDGLPKLAGLYQKVDQKLDTLTLADGRQAVKNVAISQYFDVSTDDDGSWCSANDPGKPSDGFTAEEMQWASETVGPALNKAVADGAAAADATTGGPHWETVRGIADAFKTHGYCAKDRWIRTLPESLLYQRGTGIGYDGGFHPNTEGHLLGYAARIEPIVQKQNADKIGGIPLPFEHAGVGQMASGVETLLQTLDRNDAFTTIADNLPFGAGAQVQKYYNKIFQAIRFLQDQVQAVADSGTTTLTAADEMLDDVDDDGDPTSDIHGIDGLTADFDVDIEPKVPATKYSVTMSLDVRSTGASTFAWAADSLKLAGPDGTATDTASFNSTVQFVIDPTGKGVLIPMDKPIARAGIGFEGRYGTVGADGKPDTTNKPLSFQAGLLGVTGRGYAKADIGAALTIDPAKDTDKDGYLSIAETKGQDVVGLTRLGCVSHGADVAFDVTTSVAGLTNELGKLALKDANLCDGLSAPSVQLGTLGDFRSITVADLVNGLAQVTRAIQSAQAAGDLKLPFLQDGVASVTAITDRFVKFFVDNGLTSTDQPLSTVTVETATNGVLDGGLQSLTGALSCALFGEEGKPCTDAQRTALTFAYDPATKLVTFKVSVNGTAGTVTRTLELGTSLSGNGITAVTGTATAGITPSYALDFTFGFDLTPGLSIPERFFLRNGTGDAFLTANAPMTADIDLSGAISAAGVRITDANANGGVELLKARQAGPMLSVSLVDPDNNGRVTLKELSADAVKDGRLPVTAAVNATVPETALNADVTLAGIKLATTKIVISWTDLANPQGLSIRGDAAYAASALPLSFDPSNPKALVAQLLQVTRAAVTQMREAVARGDAGTKTPLPFLGKSVAELDPALAKIQTGVDGLVAKVDSLSLASMQSSINTAIASALSVTTTPTPKFLALSYVPQTDTARAALQATLTFGACTPNRAAKLGSACTAPLPAISQPINLPLGTSGLGGLVGATGSGGVNVDLDARAKLVFGVELPRMTPGPLGGVPTPALSWESVPRPFVRGDSSVTFGLGATVDAQLSAKLGPFAVSLGKPGGGDNATAALAARVALGSATAPQKRYYIGDAELETWLRSLTSSLTTTGISETDSRFVTNCASNNGVRPDACGYLPVYFGGTKLGELKVVLPELLDPSTWPPVDTASIEQALTDQKLQLALLFEGVDQLAAQLQEGLAALPPGTKVPFIGADLTNGADYVKAFRDQMLPQLRDIATNGGNLTSAAALRKLVEDELEQVKLGEAGGSLKPTVTLTCTGGVPCGADSPVTAVTSFEVGARVFLGAQKQIPFDLGFPGLRLASTGQVKIEAGLTFDLAFGLDRTLGFYLPAAKNALTLGVTATLPHAEGPDVTGKLAFVPIEIEDRNPNDKDASAQLGIRFSTQRPDGRIPLSELSALQVTPTLDASAAINLALKTVRPNGASIGLPSISTDITAAIGVAWSPTIDPKITGDLAFQNVKVDASSLFADVVKPAIDTIGTYTAPLEKPIAVLKSPIPGAADAAREAGQQPVTWYDLFKAIAGRNGSVQVVDRVIQLVDTVGKLKSATASGALNLGSFMVSSAAASVPVPASESGSVITQASAASDPMGQLALGTAAQTDTLKKQQTEGGLSFPVIDKPSLLFGMLLGDDVSLVEYDAGSLDLRTGMSLSYPVGPATLSIGGALRLQGHFAAGFDTKGIRGVLANGTAAQRAEGLLQGFFLNDLDRNGKDVPEIKLSAEVTVGASIGVPFASVGIEGGIAGSIDFNLFTKPEQKGKVRLADIKAQLALNKNPLCFFDTTARVSAFLRLIVDLGGREEFPIADVTLWKMRNMRDWCTGVATPPSSSQGSDGWVSLQTSDGQQDFTITVTGQSTAGRSIRVDDGVDIEEYRNVRGIRGDLGLGEDSVDIRLDKGVTNTALPVTLCGGAGPDVLATEVGPATLYGDGGGDCSAVADAASGDDRLTSGDTVDRLDGGAGADTLTAGTGRDTLSGGAGDDSLVPGHGGGSIAGGSGDDTVSFAGLNKGVTGSVPGDLVSDGLTYSVDAVENVVTTWNADDITLTGSGSAFVSTGLGADTVRTGATTAVVTGGWGDDTVVDGRGGVTFYGGPGNDTVDYSAATTPVEVTVDGAAGDGVVADGRTDNIVEVETIEGGSAGDHLVAGAASSTLEGNGGDDVLDGGAGNDTLRGGPGNDTLVAGLGVDVLDGGDDTDTADYSGRTEETSVTLDGVANDGWSTWIVGRGRVYEGDNVLDTVENLTSGSGPYHLAGNAGPNRLVGGDGGGTINGIGVGQPGNNGTPDGGADVFIGGDGNDWLCDTSDCNAYATGDSSDDTFYGGAGQRDQIVGAGGDDTFHGGDGVDFISGGSGRDTIDAGEDEAADEVWGMGGDDTIQAHAFDSIEGGQGDDTILGGEGGDQFHGRLVGGAGHDVITANTGGSTIYGGRSTLSRFDDLDDGVGDTLTGLDGDDTITGGTGGDTIAAGGGNDTVIGSSGDDTIDAGSGKDSVVGDGNGNIADRWVCGRTGVSCNDTIDLGEGDDSAEGRDGNDTIHGGAGHDVIQGWDGADTIFGDEGDDWIDGGADADKLDGGTGADQLFGFAPQSQSHDDAVDTLTYAARTEKITVDDITGVYGGASDASSGKFAKEVVDRSVEGFVLGQNSDSLRLWWTRAFPVRVEGGNGHDSMEVQWSVQQPSTLVGGNGNDTFVEPALYTDPGAFTQAWADTISGGAGTDTVTYTNRPAGTAFVTLDNVANDGQTGENDDVRSDVEKVVGAATGTAPKPTMTVAPVTVAEGNDGQQVVTLKVTMSKGSTLPTSVTWRTVAGGTATAGVDYLAASGKVVLPAGAREGSFTIVVLGDTVKESAPETVRIALTAGGPATLTAPTTTVTITDDDV